MSMFLCITLFLPSTLLADSDSSVPIHGFFDLDARYVGKEDKSKFATGYLDFYISKTLSDKITVLMDIVFETIDNSYAVDIERLNIRYDYNQYLQITSGKFHTPYGYWNTAFHHGLQIQTSILRPKFIAFEDRGGVLPSHSVGIMASAFVKNFSYNVYLTSGVSIQKETEANGVIQGIITTSNGEHQDGNKLLGATFAYDMDETKIGLHSFYQKVDIFNNRQTDVLMGGGFIAMELDNLELYSELYLFYNKNTSGPSQDKYLSSSAFFIQAAYAIDEIKPYVRLERANYNQNDFYFQGQSATAGRSYDRAAFGINYNIAEDASLKFAAILNKELQNGNSVDFLTQFAVRF